MSEESKAVDRCELGDADVSEALRGDEVVRREEKVQSPTGLKSGWRREERG